MPEGRQQEYSKIPDQQQQQQQYGHPNPGYGGGYGYGQPQGYGGRNEQQLYRNQGGVYGREQAV
jgi:hypothetical protein